MPDKVEGTELIVLLLGYHRAGKTSVINTILGSNGVGEVTGQCVKREGSINGKKIAVIDAPGWWEDLTELTKLELVRSVSLCPPGPHVFLLVVDVNLVFTERHFERLVQHVQMLGDQVWEYTIVLFTWGDLLRNMTIEQHIQSQRKHLQRLLDKCGNRYHVFSNTNQGNDTQVTELFQKIEDITRKQSGRNFKTNLEKLHEVQQKWEEVQTKAVARQSRVEEERSTIKKKGYVHPLEELRVVLLGWVISGKSSAGNTILNQAAFKTGHRTTTCGRAYGTVAGRKITVLDTAGWWQFFSSKLNPGFVKATVFKSVLQCAKFPQAMLLVIPADTSFKEEQRRIIADNMAMFGEQIWRHTIVLFTWGDSLGNLKIEHHIEDEGEALQWLIEKCGNRYHVFDNTKRDDRAQVTELFEKIEEMVAANSLFRFDTRVLPEIQETKCVQLDKCGDESIEKAMNLLGIEWNKRIEELKRNVKNVLSKSSNRSCDLPPEFSRENESTDTARNVGPGETESKQFSSKVRYDIIEDVMSLMEKEWSRQESIVTENVRAILELNDAKSEATEDEIKESVDKVLWWLPDCEDDNSSICIQRMHNKVSRKRKRCSAKD